MKLFLKSLGFASFAGIAASVSAQTLVDGPHSAGDYAYALADSVTLPDPTAGIADVTSTFEINDQGFGGSDADNASLDLDVNGNTLWSINVQQVYDHSDYNTSFDLATDDPSGLASLNAALATIDYSTNPDVTIDLVGHSPGWQGWYVTVNDATTTVTLAAAPDGGYALSLFGLALTSLAFVRRKFFRA